MTGTMSTRIAALFLASTLGLLTVIGLALTPLGWAVEAPYLLVVIVGLALLVRRARALGPSTEHVPEGRTCSCCTSTVFDPVEVR